MKRSGYKGLVTVLLFTILFALTTHKAGGEETFGTHIKVLNREAPYMGDFNGDGITDNLFLLRLGAESRISDGVKLINPWSAEGNPQLSDEIADESVALGLVHGREGGNKAMVYDPEFLSTPMWKEESLPVSVLKKGSGDYNVWKKQISELKTDAVILGTEAGIDILLYWNGETYVLFWPEEEP